MKRMADIPPPETIRIPTPRALCDGSGAIDPAMGHPRVYLQIDDATGYVDCGYCDRRFVLDDGSGDEHSAAGEPRAGS
jgi:uncharacterized Zn-finger protein